MIQSCFFWVDQQSFYILRSQDEIRREKMLIFSLRDDGIRILKPPRNFLFPLLIFLNIFLRYLICHGS